MATIDRIDTGYTAWTPSSAGITTEDETYVGRHRRPGQSSLGVHEAHVRRWRDDSRLNRYHLCSAAIHRALLPTLG